MENRLKSKLISPDIQVHESAYIDENVSIGRGTQIWHFSHVMSGARIGEYCRIGQNVVIGSNVHIGANVKIQNNVSVYEGVILEDHVFCGPSCVFTNVLNPRSEIIRKKEYRQTRVKQGATIGANSTIVCGRTIGKYAFLGAGTVVVKDVPDYALVLGVPGKVAGYMCECGVGLKFKGFEAACSACHKAYRNDADRVKRVVGQV